MFQVKEKEVKKYLIVDGLNKNVNFKYYSNHFEERRVENVQMGEKSELTLVTKFKTS
jgi:hypothetical protein